MVSTVNYLMLDEFEIYEANFFKIYVTVRYYSDVTVSYIICQSYHRRYVLACILISYSMVHMDT